ncbi:2-dehydropantoate 2-reductase [Rhizobiaceae bacterium]|nr:2-dehydropantoate 2-reductase [Rhizobiaceae bacterium]
MRRPAMVVARLTAAAFPDLIGRHAGSEMNGKTPSIAVGGAGSIGCYVGACLALAGRDVILLARPDVVAAASRGIRIADLDGRPRAVAPGAVRATGDPATAFAGADIILVTVKSGDTAALADLIAAHGRPDAVVVSLQNGVGNLPVLRDRLGPGRTVLGAMIPFNVVRTDAADGTLSFHRATSGDTAIEGGRPGLAALLDVEGCPVRETRDIEAVLWGKLLLNLNNALNALSGLPLARQLADRRWRRVLAAQIAEALAVMRRAGIRPARIGAIRPGLLPMLLRLPDALFVRLARRMLAIDPTARSSMWEDLQRGRRTEIAEFQGAIERLAAANGIDAPLSRRIAALVREAEAEGRGSPGVTPEAVGGRS